jgi:esterase/lipase
VTPRLEPRHHPSGWNDRFNGGGLAFAAYIACTRDMIRRARSGAENLEAIVDGNAPFELRPSAGFDAGRHKIYRRGVLLTHGLSDSPYSMRHLAKFFSDNGFRVMAVLLPGHGTQPGDLLDVTWTEWAKAVAYGADRLDEEVDEIYLAGYSSGATLSVYHSLHDSRVRSLFLFSPAIRITPMAALANFHKLYSWLIPRAKWVDIMPDRDIYKYESFTKNAAAQAHALTMKVKSYLNLRGLHIPVFIAASEDDITVRTTAIFGFVGSARHSWTKLILYTTEPDKYPSGFLQGRLEAVNSAFPGQGILSSAHTGILIAPDDPHYGVKADYFNCIHYYPDELEKYVACLEHPEDDLQGEVTKKNLAAGIMRRLTYNPSFSMLKTSLKVFLDGLP